MSDKGALAEKKELVIGVAAEILVVMIQEDSAKNCLGSVDKIKTAFETLVDSISSKYDSITIK